MLPCCLKKRTAREIIGFGFVSMPMILQPLLSFLFLVSVANTSPVEIYGVLSLSIVLTSVLVSFSDVGLRDYLLSKGGIEKGLSQGENLFFPTLFIFIILMFFLCAYVFFSASAVAFYIFLAYLPEAFAFGVLHKCIFFSYQRELDAVGFSKIDIFHKSTPFIIKILVLLIFENLAAAVLAGSVVSFAMYSVWFSSRCIWGGRFFSSNEFDLASVLMKMARSWKSWLPFTISFLSFFLYFSSDRIVIDAILGSRDLAIYAAAYSFITVGQVFVSALWSLYMPKISRGKEPFSRSFFLKLSVLASGILVVLYEVFAWLFFDIFYPGEYGESKVILSVLAMFFLFRIPNVILEMYWVAWERYGLFTRLRVLSGILNVVLNISLIPFFGLIVAALTTVLSEALLMLSILLYERKKSKMISG